MKVFFLLILLLLYLGINGHSTTKSTVSNLPSTPTQKNRLKSALQTAKVRALRGGLYGAMAGSIQVISLMWLRTIINYQYRFGVTFDEALKQLYNEGGIQRFYRGLPYALVQNPLSKFGAVAANEASRELSDYLVGNNNISYALVSSLLGTSLSVMWKLLIVPVETCKTILQVDGLNGFNSLSSQLRSGRIGLLYEGAAASLLATISSHYPWFYTYNTLDRIFKKPINKRGIIIRSAIMGFIASVVSDVMSNFIRVIKTVKQSVAVNGHCRPSYIDIVTLIMKDGGFAAIFSRGLLTRIIANCIQSIMFTIIWNFLPVIVERLKTKQNSKQIEQIEETH